jgi:hypothetical protein
MLSAVMGQQREGKPRVVNGVDHEANKNVLGHVEQRRNRRQEGCKNDKRKLRLSKLHQPHDSRALLRRHLLHVMIRGNGLDLVRISILGLLA